MGPKKSSLIKNIFVPVCASYNIRANNLTSLRSVTKASSNFRKPFPLLLRFRAYIHQAKQNVHPKTSAATVEPIKNKIKNEEIIALDVYSYGYPQETQPAIGSNNNKQAKYINTWEMNNNHRSISSSSPSIVKFGVRVFVSLGRLCVYACQ